MSRAAETPTVEPATKVESEYSSYTRAVAALPMERRNAPAHRTDHGAVSAAEDTSPSDPKPSVSNAPLGPPPRPTTTGDTPDYFNT